MRRLAPGIVLAVIALAVAAPAAAAATAGACAGALCPSHNGRGIGRRHRPTVGDLA
jgi:hypothetical protein